MRQQSRLTPIFRVDAYASNGDAQVELVGGSEVRHPVDGRLVVKVDAGVFSSGPSNEPVWLPAFYIDVHPVRNAEYWRFTAATGHAAPRHWVEGKYPERLADHPLFS